MRRPSTKPTKQRRGAIAVLAAILCVILLGMIAFAADVGYLGTAKTQLQATADSTALAAAAAASQGQSNAFPAAQYFASQNTVAGRAAQIASGSTADVQFGTWDTGSRTFTSSSTVGNAVKVTVRADANNGGQTKLFFGRLFGLTGVTQSATAIATMNPRDIAFVVDLSGSMNDDTDPYSSTVANSTIMQQVYTDLGFGTYPGGTVTMNTYQSDSWIMRNQMPSVMPNAIPTPNAYNTTSCNYWGSYFDYVRSNGGQLGFQSYLSFLMFNGRDGQPDGSNNTPLSLSSDLCSCPMHTETVGGTSFSFPPREMPTHAMRRALIAAIQVVQSCNQSITDVNQKDWVSIITFDKASSTSPKIQQALTSTYTTVMTACTQLQAVSSNGYSTNTEAGLSLAASHIKPQSQGGAGRERTNKIVVLLTDGQPNLKQSTSTTISNYKGAHPSTWTNPNTGQTLNNWSVTGDFTTEQQAALMQTSMMQGNNWYLYAAGVGDACTGDAKNFMDCMARMGNTADTSGLSLSGGSNPSTYEANMTQIFRTIITNPKLRLVK